ncbi:MAG: hypothetical protein JXA42_21345, partial [Anaerolineales bacterium]|nr:hypothetical protein [Anaerolineales bacterium]
MKNKNTFTGRRELPYLVYGVNHWKPRAGNKMINQFFCKIKFSLLFSVFSLTACYSSPVTSQVIPEPSSIIFEVSQQATVTRAVTPRKTPTLTWRPTNIPSSPTPTNIPPSKTPLATLTRILTPTMTPSPTVLPTLQPPEPITDREPTIEQIEAFLLCLPDEYFQSSDLRRYDWIGKNFGRNLTDHAELNYLDVNGDNIVDLVVSDYLVVAVFIWDGAKYSNPFVLVDESLYLVPSSRITFEDWTGDGVPEIIANYRLHGNGTGMQGFIYYRFIIHCQENKCQIVWSVMVDDLTNQANFGGMTFFSSSLQTRIDGDGKFQLLSRSNGFSFYDFSFIDDDMFSGVSFENVVESLVVFTSTISYYDWTGKTFQLVEEQVLDNMYRIQSNYSLEATNEMGAVASIVYEDNHCAGKKNDVCQLLVEGAKVGDPFGCKYKFTTVEWIDLVSDSQDEILVRTTSGGSPLDNDGKYLSGGKGCVHQRFIIYQWFEIGAKKIADIAGCVVQSDLFGV